MMVESDTKELVIVVLPEIMTLLYGHVVTKLVVTSVTTIVLPGYGTGVLMLEPFERVVVVW